MLAGLTLLVLALSLPARFATLSAETPDGPRTFADARAGRPHTSWRS
jgi:hypothetical protein